MHGLNFKNIILHPFFLGLYPVVALLGHNITEMHISEATRALLFMFIVVALSVIVNRLIFRSWRRAALVTSFLVIAFFSYGYLYDFLQQNYPDLPIGRHRFLIPLYFVVICIGLWWITRIRDLDTATQALNLVGIIALIFPLYQIVSHVVITSIEVISKKTESTKSVGLTGTDDAVYPDIYYIILDSYPRDDVLQDVYDYDNSEFLNQLTEMGFYIAECSQSNYSKTSHSLLSSLNLNYLDILTDIQSPAAWMSFSEVRKHLSSHGYSTVAFATGYPMTELRDVDIYLQPDEFDKDVFGPKQSADIINNFEALLISTSGLVFMDALSLFDIEVLPNTNEANVRSIVNLGPEKRRYVEASYTFDELKNMPAIPGPKFVFAHLMVPHNPYVFAPDGTFDPRQAPNKEAFVDQLSYVNKRMISIVTEIIENSDTPPIIIIQGDHGAPEVEFTQLRVMILNAYFLPYGGDEMLYSTITPVNTFRLILDYYFGTEYGLLEEISYNSKSNENSFDYDVIPNQCDR
jgi:hypothetical protein